MLDTGYWMPDTGYWILDACLPLAGWITELGNSNL